MSTNAVASTGTVAGETKAQAFEQVVQAYEGRVYNLALRLLGDPDQALDVTQEAFVRALQALQRFRRESSFYTWICRIAINLCYSERRRQGRRRQSSLGELMAAGSGDTEVAPVALVDPRSGEPIEHSQSRERDLLVQHAVSSLPRELRFVVVLRDMEGLSYEEVAETLRIPIGTVRSRLHRARDVLRGRLRAWLQDDL